VGGIAFRSTGSVELAIVTTLLTAVGVSLFNGVLVARLGLSAIMVTLAAFIWERGLALAFTRGDPVPVGGWLTGLVTWSVGGVTITAPLVIGAFVAGWWVLRHTRFGRYTYAVGGDPAAARRARIDITRTTLLVFGLMGLMVGVGSVVVMGQLASAQPYVASQLALDAIIAVVIGGTRLMGGEGGVGRTALGLAFVAILNSGLLNLGLQDAWYQLIKGSVLVVVLAVQISLRRIAEVAERRDLERQAAAASGAGGSPGSAGAVA
jgi:ribose transport system permease protein